jgi:hypothetical protein
MIQERPSDHLFVYPVALVGPVGEGDVLKLWRLLDIAARTRGRVSVLLDVTEAEGPPPGGVEVRPLAVPAAIVRAAVRGRGDWGAWARRFLGVLVQPPVRSFGSDPLGLALRYARTFPDPERSADEDAQRRALALADDLQWALDVDAATRWPVSTTP